MKAKPGSQGTLFQGGSDQMTDKKWPRGYTPERLHEVKSAVLPDKRILADNPRMYPYDTAGDTRKLVDTIARSTVPVGHLQSLQFEPGLSKYAMMDTGPNADPMVPGGLYEKPRETAGPSYMRRPEGPATIKLLEGVAGGHIPIHEIGHHVSLEQGTEHSAYSNPRQRGQEEAFADNYAQQHYRPRRGERYQGVGMYNGGERDHIRSEQFFDAYHAHRDYAPIFGTNLIGRGRGRRTPPPPPPPGAIPPLPGLEGYWR
jgi:hypothetical protein